MNKQIFWVQGPKNREYPLKLHKLDEAARLADEIKADVFMELENNFVSIVYEYNSMELEQKSV